MRHVKNLVSFNFTKTVRAHSTYQSFQDNDSKRQHVGAKYVSFIKYDVRYLLQSLRGMVKMLSYRHKFQFHFSFCPQRFQHFDCLRA